MIFFSENRLAKDLHIGAVTEKQQVYYLLIVSLFVTAWSTTAVSHFFYDPKSNVFDHLTDITDLIATAVFVFYFSFINAKGDNRDFITRYVCLSVPVGIKAIVLALFFGTLAAGVEILRYGDVQDDNGGSLSEFLIYLLIELFLFWRYQLAFKLASGQSKK